MAYDLEPIKAPVLAGLPLRLVCVLAEGPPLGNAMRAFLYRSAGVDRIARAELEEAPPLAPLMPRASTLPAEAAPPGPEPDLEALPRVAAGAASAGASASAASASASAAPASAASASAPAGAGAAPAASASSASAPAASAPAASAPVASAGPDAPFAFETALDLVERYRDGSLSPEAVCERVLYHSHALDQGPLPLRTFIAQRADDVRQQAAASAQRYRDKKPLGPLDGVPIAIKDEVDQQGYPTTVGTRFLGRTAATHDAETVARLRAQGALLIGKANMHEIGLGVTGLNPHHGAARNPYDPRRLTGGSSSGSAVAVAAGLCPVALGADGGGSIRLPAALCGLVGLKATHGRVSEHGAAPLCWSMGHLGPIAGSALDAALAYRVLAGPDPKDPMTLSQPAPTLAGFDRADLKGVRLGVYRPWFEHAEAPIVAACDRALEALKAQGAEVRSVDLGELFLFRIAHMVTIVSEMATAHLAHHRQHRRRYGLDVRLNLALAYGMRATDYVQAQRLRSRLTARLDRALGEVDAIITPSTACTAKPLPEGVALRTGQSNLPLLEQIMRFAQPANLSGLPAITFPVGYDPDGLPIGMQAMGRAWEEALLLRIARVADALFPRRRPARHVRLLDPAPGAA